jgi:hypothetical protein
VYVPNQVVKRVVDAVCALAYDAAPLAYELPALAADFSDVCSEDEQPLYVARLRSACPRGTASTPSTCATCASARSACIGAMEPSAFTMLKSVSGSNE